jgi:hypothetical protein
MLWKLEMFTESSTFSWTNFYFIFFSFLWHEILILMFNTFCMLILLISWLLIFGVCSHPRKFFMTFLSPLPETRQFGTHWKRQFGTKTFRYRWKKVSNRHRIFFETNVITFFKIKSTKILKKHQHQNIIYLNIL